MEKCLSIFNSILNDTFNIQLMLTDIEKRIFFFGSAKYQLLLVNH